MNKKRIFFFSFVLLLWLIIVVDFDSLLQKFQDDQSKIKALKIADNSEEVKAMLNVPFFQMNTCIEKKVNRPCDTDWVTCIEDVWVIEYHVGEACGVNHDGRLNLTMLVDDKSNTIISKFPEKEYYNSSSYCHDGFDCLYLKEDKNDNHECLNFVYGQTAINREFKGSGCICHENSCVLAEDQLMK